MRTIELRPIHDTQEEFEELERVLSHLFYVNFYRPLLKSLQEPDESRVENSFSDDLLTAIRSGRISFERGHFRGQFNAAISRKLKRLGAKWDRRHGSFKIPLGSLPTDIRAEIRNSETALIRIVSRLKETISKFVPEEIADLFHANDIFDRAIFRVDKDIRETLKKITIQPAVTKDQARHISEQYTRNARLDIKNWTAKEIVTLRDKVQQMVMDGKRRPEIEKYILSRHAVSKNKAKFIARQESNIMMAKFKESRYKSAGIADYKWRCVVGSPNHPVRPMHKKLDGKTFQWNSPPVVNDKGERKHPGEDYNCRCYAIPIVRF